MYGEASVQTKFWGTNGNRAVFQENAQLNCPTNNVIVVINLCTWLISHVNIAIAKTLL